MRGPFLDYAIVMHLHVRAVRFVDDFGNFMLLRVLADFHAELLAFFEVLDGVADTRLRLFVDAQDLWVAPALVVQLGLAVVMLDALNQAPGLEADTFGKFVLGVRPHRYGQMLWRLVTRAIGHLRQRFFALDRERRFVRVE